MKLLRRKSWSWSSKSNISKKGEEERDNKDIQILSSTITSTLNLHAQEETDSLESIESSGVVSLPKVGKSVSLILPPPLPEAIHSKQGLNRSSSIYQVDPPLNPIYTGIPVNRLALIDKSDILAFNHQLSCEYLHIEQNYYFRWLVWYYKENKIKTIVKCIETSRDLIDFMNHEYNDLVHKNIYRQFFIARYGIIPNRKCIKDGYTIEIKIPIDDDSKDYEENTSVDDHDEQLMEEQSIKKFFTLLLESTCSNRIYNTIDHLKISICGINLKYISNHIRISIWIYPIPNQTYNKEFIIEQTEMLINVLRSCITNEFKHLFNKVLFMNNNDDSTIILEFI
ncbi:uncharacterized protein RJT21DRAFT_128782 [Scheffersomyces amazonensis]|uniref:uncharacterized protein n=1 Tax=Scheffersomyces amazonensis TaxID=1078765 RepID=UPI00315C737B